MVTIPPPGKVRLDRVSHNNHSLSEQKDHDLACQNRRYRLFVNIHKRYRLFDWRAAGMTGRRKSDSAMAELHRIKQRMPKPMIYKDKLYVRAPEGTLERIRAVSKSEAQGAFVRRLLLSALKDLESQTWTPSIPPEGAVDAQTGIKRRLPKPAVYKDKLYVRAPEGTLDRIRNVAKSEAQGAFVRRLLLSALTDLETGAWAPSIVPDRESVGEKKPARPRAPKPVIFKDKLYVRAPEGTLARIRAIAETEGQGAFVRRLLLSALADIESGKWLPSIPRKAKNSRKKKAE